MLGLGRGYNELDCICAYFEAELHIGIYLEDSKETEHRDQERMGFELDVIF